MKSVIMCACCALTVSLAQGYRAPMKLINISDSVGIYSLELSGEIQNYNEGDSLILWLSDAKSLTYQETNQVPFSTYKAEVRNGRFSFKIHPRNDIGFLYLYRKSFTEKKQQPLLNEYLTEDGDEVYVKFGNDTIIFSGKGSEKYTFKHLMEENEERISRRLFTRQNYHRQWHENKRFGFEIFGKMDTIQQYQLSNLNRIKRRLTNKAYNILYANIIGNYRKQLIRSITAQYIFREKRDTLVNLEKLRKVIRNYFVLDTIEQGILARSPLYLDYLKARMRLFSVAFDESYVDQIKGFPKGVLRDKVIAMLFFKYYRTLDNPDYVVNESLGLLCDSTYRHAILTLHTNNKTGAKAPDFSLLDENGDSIALKDFRNKVVYIHFWFVGCTPCAYVYKHVVAPVESEFENNPKVVFISVCVGKNQESWKRALESGKYTSQKAVNLITGKSWNESDITISYNISSAPQAVLIDGNGRIISRKPNELRSSAEKLSEIIRKSIISDSKKKSKG